MFITVENLVFFWARLSACLLVCMSVRMEQLDTHWTYFDEIWYMCTCQKYVENSKFH